MTRLALVRVPDDAPDPAGLIGWYTTRAPRRYAVVTDLAAWTAWVAEHAPEHVTGCCGTVDRAFEAGVRRWVASTGAWPGPGGVDLVPEGMEARCDSAVRIHVTTPDGSIDSWESPLDVTPQEVSA